ncbi:MAG: hypothetical protein NC834_01020 [Candidatus Omnitrophica bacterium]|nr:hypothetical protein [Candidatus Omnitrophota bacterium]
MRKIGVITGLVVLLILNSQLLAQLIPSKPEEETTSQEKTLPASSSQTEPKTNKSLLEKVNALESRVQTLEKIVAQQQEIIKRYEQALQKAGEVIPEVKTALAPPEPKVLVKHFVLTGVNLFDPKDFEPILSKYRDKELGISDLKKAADEITAFYRSKGYLTSLAYAPTQEITNHTVEFKIVEGRVGDIEVEGGKYFKKEPIEKKIMLEEGEILDYAKLQTDIRRLNKQPDRTMKAVLLPGKEQGLTDILIKMEEEKKPYHFYLDFSNRGTKYTTQYRYGIGFTHNNLLGQEDILTARANIGEDEDVYAGSIDYNFPISRYNTRLGVYGAYSHADIGGQFKVLTPEGKATAYGVYLSHPWLDKDFADPTALNLSSNVILGLDAISVYNKILGEETSHDELRVLKAGISFDERDSLGRTFFSQEIRQGLDDFLGSMDKNDPSASRLDASSDFTKYVGSLTRLTRLPFSSLLINSLKYQVTSDPLVNSEQMGFGGADSIRGFPENDYLADYGWMSTIELRTPAFLFPREIKVPYDKKGRSLMDSLQFVYFIDFGKAHLKYPRVGEKKDRFLSGAGLGLRFDLYDHLRGRIDWGMPIGNEEPSDGSNGTVHIGVQYEF